jgi:hypothetical protein
MTLRIEVAVRAWTEGPPRRTRSGRGIAPPIRIVLVFDTETTIDPTQALTFGCWRVYQIDDSGWECVEEGLLVADDLATRDPAAMGLLRGYARTHGPSVAGHRRDRRRELRVLTRAEFVRHVFYPVVFKARGTVIGFNLPFDLSRLACVAGEGRKGMAGGFSLSLMRHNGTNHRYRPTIGVKHLNRHAAFMHLSDALGTDIIDRLPNRPTEV